MPGHPVPKGHEGKVKEDVERLEKLFDEHDAAFLLMDSRESRWLPTVLGAAKGKVSGCSDFASSFLRVSGFDIWVCACLIGSESQKGGPLCLLCWSVVMGRGMLEH